MSAITRKIQQIFASALAAPDNISVWGSLAGGSESYSNDPATIQSAAWLNGLNGALIGNRSPTFQDLNGLFYVLTYQLAYLLQNGVAEWDPSGNTPYFLNQLARVGKIVYQVKVAGPVGATSPVTDTNNWQTYQSGLTGPNLIRASVVFDGTQTDGYGNCIILNAFNVTSVAKLATGKYVVNFPSSAAMPVDGSGNGIYGLGGSCGTRNGVVAVAGDNNILGAYPGNAANGLRTATQCQIDCWESATVGPPGFASFGFEDSNCVSAIFF